MVLPQQGLHCTSIQTAAHKAGQLLQGIGFPKEHHLYPTTPDPTFQQMYLIENIPQLIF